MCWNKKKRPRRITEQRLFWAFLKTHVLCHFFFRKKDPSV